MQNSTGVRSSSETSALQAFSALTPFLSFFTYPLQNISNWFTPPADRLFDVFQTPEFKTHLQACDILRRNTHLIWQTTLANQLNPDEIQHQLEETHALFLQENLSPFFYHQCLQHGQKLIEKTQKKLELNFQSFLKIHPFISDTDSTLALSLFADYRYKLLKNKEILQNASQAIQKAITSDNITTLEYFFSDVYNFSIRFSSGRITQQTLLKAVAYYSTLVDENFYAQVFALLKSFTHPSKLINLHKQLRELWSQELHKITEVNHLQPAFSIPVHENTQIISHAQNSYGAEFVKHITSIPYYIYKHASTFSNLTLAFGSIYLIPATLAYSTASSCTIINNRFLSSIEPTSNSSYNLFPTFTYPTQTGYLTSGYLAANDTLTTSVIMTLDSRGYLLAAKKIAAHDNTTHIIANSIIQDSQNNMLVIGTSNPYPTHQSNINANYSNIWFTSLNSVQEIKLSKTLHFNMSDINFSGSAIQEFRPDEYLLMGGDETNTVLTVFNNKKNSYKSTYIPGFSGHILQCPFPGNECFLAGKSEHNTLHFMQLSVNDTKALSHRIADENNNVLDVQINSRSPENGGSVMLGTLTTEAGNKHALLIQHKAGDNTLTWAITLDGKSQDIDYNGVIPKDAPSWDKVQYNITGNAVQITSSGYLIVGSVSQSSNNKTTNSKILIATIRFAGNLYTSATLLPPEHNASDPIDNYAIVPTANGNYLITGISKATQAKMLLGIVDSNGNIATCTSWPEAFSTLSLTNRELSLLPGMYSSVPLHISSLDHPLTISNITLTQSFISSTISEECRDSLLFQTCVTTIISAILYFILLCSSEKMTSLRDINNIPDSPSTLKKRKVGLLKFTNVSKYLFEGLLDEISVEIIKYVTTDLEAYLKLSLINKRFYQYIHTELRKSEILDLLISPHTTYFTAIANKQINVLLSEYIQTNNQRWETYIKNRNNINEKLVICFIKYPGNTLKTMFHNLIFYSAINFFYIFFITDAQLNCNGDLTAKHAYFINTIFERVINTLNESIVPTHANGFFQNLIAFFNATLFSLFTLTFNLTLAYGIQKSVKIGSFFKHNHEFLKEEKIFAANFSEKVRQDSTWLKDSQYAIDFYFWLKKIGLDDKAESFYSSTDLEKLAAVVKIVNQHLQANKKHADLSAIVLDSGETQPLPSTPATAPPSIFAFFKACRNRLLRSNPQTTIVVNDAPDRETDESVALLGESSNNMRYG